MKAAVAMMMPMVMLAGCMDDRPGMPGPVRECRAGPAQRLIGAPFNKRTGNDIRNLTGARTMRPLGPGQAATMDFRPDRVTIDLDGQRRIRAIRCG